MSDTLRYLPFESVWKMRIDHPYSLFVRDGNLLWSCGQCPLNETGEVLHPNDLFAQAAEVSAFIDQFLSKIDADRSHIAQLVVYHVKTGGTDALELRRLFRERFGEKVIVLPVSIPHFYYDGMMIEVDVYGSTLNKVVRTLTDNETGIELQIVDSGEIVWAGILGPREVQLEAALNRLLTRADLSLNALLSEQWFVTTDRLGEEVRLLTHTSGTDPRQIVGIRDDGFPMVAQLTFSRDMVTREQFAASSHLIEGVDIRLTRTEGYFDLTGTCEESIGLVQDTQRIMSAIEWALKHSGLSFFDVRKATTHYVAGSSAEELHDNMSIRNRYYRKPGPASTGLPVFSFPMASSPISIRLLGRRSEAIPNVPGDGDNRR